MRELFELRDHFHDTIWNLTHSEEVRLSILMETFLNHG